MNSSPLVSVIIPNYNHAVFLPKRIESVLNQSFQDIEIIILDDCSTDKSQEIILQFAEHKKIKFDFNKKNTRSPFKQWNKGVTLAQGKYIWIAESDDFADQNFLSSLIPHLEKNPDVGVAYSQSWVVDEKDNVIENKLDWTKELDSERWKNDYKNEGLNECMKYLFHKPIIPNASAVLFRKEIYLKTGMADENFVMCGDWMHWVKMLMISNVYFCAKSLNYFRRHSGTTRHILTHAKVLTKIREEYQILSYIISHADMPKTLENKLLNDYFNRSIEFCPVNLKFSLDFFKFISIVQKVDSKVYLRTLKFILKRAFTYIPEKLN